MVSRGDDDRVLSVVSAEVVPPYPDRPTEGFLNFNVELSPMASISADVRITLQHALGEITVMCD